MFLFNYALVVTMGIGHLITNNGEYFALGKFYIGFVMMTMIKFTFLVKYSLRELIDFKN